MPFLDSYPVIAVYAHRVVVDACTFHCYDLDNVPSPCICGGHNAGIGWESAIYQNLDRLADIRKRISKRYPAATHHFLILPVRKRPTASNLQRVATPFGPITLDTETLL